MTARVAITQHAIGLGGRLQVIIGIVQILNQYGICPDIISSKLMFHPDQVEENYGVKIDANYIHAHVPRIPLLIDEFRLMLFNRKLQTLTRNHDLIINTNNSLYSLPPDKDIVTYMFFPRKRRMNANVIDIHMPEKPLKVLSRLGIQRVALRRLYKNVTPTNQNQIVCMTKFTAQILQSEYPGINVSKIVYPPVDLASFLPQNTQNENAVQESSPEFSGSLSDVITTGRFSPNKRQLEQIRLAQKMPHINFHLAGFAQNNAYFIRCKEYVDQQQLNNVYLYPDAPFEKLQSLMHQCGIFLHTLIDEPFGITAVQAVAAGCIPIVHNSGGQQETICEPSLRYASFEEVPTIVNALQRREQSDIHDLFERLQSHVQQFDAPVFRQEMQGVLDPYLS